MEKELIVTWKKESSGKYFPIGILKSLQKGARKVYYFSYTKGVIQAKNEGFSPLFGETKDGELKRIYISEDGIFPVFANRLMTKSRPEYPQYKQWLDIKNEDNPLEELAKNNGIRATDNLQVFAIPEKKNGKYIVDFFIHKFDLIAPEFWIRIKDFKIDDRLYLTQDIQNPYDKNALLIRTEEPLCFFGYVPRFYTKDFLYLLNQKDSQATLRILRINIDAPLLYRVFCRFESSWSEDFEPFASEEFESF